MKAIPFGRPVITDSDRAAVAKVLEGHVLTHGPECAEFEKEFGAFLGADCRCVTVSSCAAALNMAYFYMKIGDGDEVIVPAMTHTATAHAVELCGARPVFVDCDPATGNIDLAGIKSAITPRTKVISLVHFLGIPCRMDEIMEIARHHNLRVVEDCALAVGSRYEGRHAGLWGDFGCFSFYPVKHMTTGEGGMLVSRDKDAGDSVAKLRAFGVNRSHSERTVPGMYDVDALGLNYRMSEMQAALGRSQLRAIESNLFRRSDHFNRLTAALSDAKDITIIDGKGNSHYCLSVVLGKSLLERRSEFIARLNEAGVGTSIYYPHPVPRLSYYRNKYGYEAGLYPNATAISDASIALPVGPHIDNDDIDAIADHFLRIVR